MSASFPVAAATARLGRGPWSPVQIGIYVGPDAVAAVEVGAGSVPHWVLSGPAPVDGETLTTSITELLSRMPRSHGSWRRPRAVVGMHGEFAQYKRLWGLPPVADPTVGSALVRENAARFFRQTPHGLSTSAVVVRAPGEIWASAVDTSIVRTVSHCCKTHGVDLGALIPMDSVAADSPAPAVLADDASVKAWRLARIAAASGDIDFNSATLGTFHRTRSPRRERFALAALCMASALLATLPVLDAQRSARIARQGHAAIAAREAEALAMVAELNQVDAALLAIAQAQVSRRHSIDVIAHLTATLPPGAAITHLQLDSLGGTVTALASSADGVIKGLAASPLIVQPEIVGPVTRDRSAGREFDRLAVRFRHPVRQAPVVDRRSEP